MVLLSGFVFPIENMPAAIQPFTYLIPLRYFLVILRSIFLKGVGLELFATGRVEPETGDEVIVVERSSPRSYRRLVLSSGRAVGAIVLGHHPGDQAAAHVAVRHRLEVSPAARDTLRSGDWSTLHDIAATAPS